METVVLQQPMPVVFRASGARALLWAISNESAIVITADGNFESGVDLSRLRAEWHYDEQQGVWRGSSMVAELDEEAEDAWQEPVGTDA